MGSRRLYCDGNKLTALPAAIARLTQLETYVLFNCCCGTYFLLTGTIVRLNCANNEITSLPEFLFALPKLNA